MIIYFTKLTDEAILPTRKFVADAGMDVYSSVDIVIPGNSSRVVNTGVAIANFMEETYVQVSPKGRSDYLIGGGIIDAEYRGEILVKIVNYSTEDIVIHKGDAIAQLIVKKIEVPEIEEMSKETLASVSTPRGATGGIVTQVSDLSLDPDVSEFERESDA